MTIHNLLNAIEQAKAHNINTLNQLEVLLYIANGLTNPSQIQAGLRSIYAHNLSLGSISSILKILLNENLVEENSDSEDRRLKWFKLTKHGNIIVTNILNS